MTIRKDNTSSMKELVLRFVESMGTATFTDIQRFVVDHNYGKGTYNKSFCKMPRFVSVEQEKTMYSTPLRGYYCDRLFGSNPDLMYGDTYLVRVARCKYQAVFDGPKLRSPWEYQCDFNEGEI